MNILKPALYNQTMLRVLLLVLTSTLFIWSNSYATEKETITWFAAHWPPLMMLRGDDKGSGRVDMRLQLYQSKLSQYNHKILEMSWGRFWHDIKAGKKICSPMHLKKPDRLKIAYFSTPVDVAVSHRIIMKKTNAALLNSPASYSIIKLITDRRFKGIVESQRSYTKELDEIFTGHEKNSNFQKITIAADSLFKMLDHNRINYIIEYPFIASYHGKQYFKNINDYASIQIDEITPYFLVYTVCPRNDWGKQVISDINNMLKTLIHQEEYKKIIFESWLDKNDLIQIKDVYKNQILNQI
ncbi:TIGR02285 family protein [Endozoicomonas sp. SM1973]|uniref:TIGR02285 family protein n=1 Tax=Spartinivicinus marinus TaxID=2994442 RepID=A0A853HYL2_9GAMM|nr:TIGR02285 family protein [Spartinivicinus marinus]MCX4026458.1 TIGR02285 family protein [Spartinivicinus marinus]NYZ66830.1 TIGR02285 family protein [Spartinivicinus marinus]